MRYRAFAVLAALLAAIAGALPAVAGEDSTTTAPAVSLQELEARIADVSGP